MSARQLTQGSYARALKGSAAADIADLVETWVPMLDSTTSSAPVLTHGSAFDSDWAVIVPRLLFHDQPERRWLTQWVTSVAALLPAWFAPQVEELVPSGYVLEVEESPPRSAASERNAVAAGRDLHLGLRAVDDIRRWLSLSIADVASLARLSASTIYWWAENPTSVPRPAKIDRLLGLHALIGGLVDDLGEDLARGWIRSGRPSRLDRLRTEVAALEAVEAEGYDFLLGRARERLAASGPGRPVTDDDDRRDLDRLAEQERQFREPLHVEQLDPAQLEPDDLE